MGKYEITTGTVQAPVKVVLYGPEGIGKSTFASRFPRPVFIDTEGGTKRLDVRRLPAPTSWAMLLDETAEVSRGNVDCKTLVVDTADWAERLCIAAVCARAKVNGIEDFGYGKGYTYAKEEFAKLLDALEEVVRSGRNVVITAHAQIAKFEQPDAVGNYDRWQMKTSKHVAPLLREWCDMLLFANYKTTVEKAGSGPNAKNKASGGRRVLYTSHHACWDAKNRFGLPEECGFDYSVIAPFVPGASAEPAQPAAQPAPKPLPAQPEPHPAEQDILQAPGPQKDLQAIAAAARPALEADLNAKHVPPALRDLMVNGSVSDEMLRHAVYQRGCYPEDTPISAYDPKFVQGSLVASWDKWLAFILDNSDIPF